jgi:hypothetical protein
MSLQYHPCCLHMSPYRQARQSLQRRIQLINSFNLCSVNRLSLVGTRPCIRARLPSSSECHHDLYALAELG